MGLNDAHALTPSIARVGRGLFARNTSPRATPALPLELYEFESCPFCRKVRDVLSELDLGYVARTCARGSAKRSQVLALGGKAMFPFLVDPNTGRQMYESEDIITYLMETYGSGRSGVSKALAPLNLVSAAVASALRPLGGAVKSPRAEQPEQLLVLWQFEASPFCRKVREALAVLDLDYHVRNVAKGSRHREEFKALSGRMMVPYLVDDNTGAAMHESDDIVAYLHETYGVSA